MDVLTKDQRHYNMTMIKCKDTTPEIIVRKFLYANGFRYRKNDGRYPGKPDIVLPKYKTVVFVNGCFWHHHNCKYFTLPKTNSEFWKRKISENVERDNKNYKTLSDDGWKIVVLWECELKKEPDRTNRLIDLISQIKS